MSKQLIATEVTRQLKLVKLQLDFEISADLKAMETRLMDSLEDLRADLTKELENIRKEARSQTEAVSEATSAKSQNQLAISERMQLAVIEQTKEHINKATRQMGQQVYSKITDEINTKIAPKLENLVQYVNYSNQDTAEMITNYRNAVQVNGDHQSGPGVGTGAPGVKFIF